MSHKTSEITGAREIIFLANELKDAYNKHCAGLRVVIFKCPFCGEMYTSGNSHPDNGCEGRDIMEVTST